MACLVRCAAVSADANANLYRDPTGYAHTERSSNRDDHSARRTAEPRADAVTNSGGNSDYWKRLLSGHLS